jgi:hypothetical protein
LAGNQGGPDARGRRPVAHTRACDMTAPS